LTALQALVLAVVQGLTEFIPVSSSAHLAIVPWLLDWGAPNVAFDVLLHLGTLLSLIAYFRRDLSVLIGAWLRSLGRLLTGRGLRALVEDEHARLAWLLLAGCVPTAIIGFTLKHQFESAFQHPSWIAVFLIITGVWLVIAQRVRPGAKESPTTAVKDALLVGLAQGIAIAPGISRSGATIGMGLLCGLNRQFAPRFAFLLAIPAIVGAAVFKLPELRQGAHAVAAGPAIIGLVASAVSGYLAIMLVMRVVREGRLDRFAYYCWLVAVAVLVAVALGVRPAMMQ